LPISNRYLSNLLKNTTLFERCSKPLLGELAKNMEEASFNEGDIIFNTKEIGKKSFLIVEGSVKILRNNVLMARYKEGELFAEFSMLGGKAYSAQAKAETDVTAYTLHHDHFYNLIREETELAESVIKDLSRRLKRHL